MRHRYECKEEWFLRSRTFSYPLRLVALLAGLLTMAAFFPVCGYAGQPLPREQKGKSSAAAPGGQKASSSQKTSARSARTKDSPSTVKKPKDFKADVFFPEGQPVHHDKGEQGLFGMKPSPAGQPVSPPEGALAKASKVVSIETASDAPPFDPLSPRRGPLPGGGYAKDQPQSLSPELSVKYSVGNRTSTRLSINNQNPSSPLFIPTDGPARTKSTGLFVDSQTKEDVEVHVGVEYKSIDERNPGNTPPIEDKGASFGVMWKF